MQVKRSLTLGAALLAVAALAAQTGASPSALASTAVTIPAGQGPLAVAVDDRTGTDYVTTSPTAP